MSSLSRDAQILAIAPYGPGNSVDKYIGKNGAFPFPLFMTRSTRYSTTTTLSRRSCRIGQRPGSVRDRRRGGVVYNQVGT